MDLQTVMECLILSGAEIRRVDLSVRQTGVLITLDNGEQCVEPILPGDSLADAACRGWNQLRGNRERERLGAFGR